MISERALDQLHGLPNGERVLPVGRQSATVIRPPKVDERSEIKLLVTVEGEGDDAVVLVDITINAAR